MNQTQTFQLETVEPTWAHFSCSRLATPAEMAACAYTCACGTVIAAKLGHTIQGTALGHRSGPTEPWIWSTPRCRSCEIAHAIADGY